jgi:NAD-dependent SIR2 family protein deacetylase
MASLRQKIRDEVRSTSSVHKFVRVLRDGGRLMRCYTQNIDGLESREGLVTDLARGKGNKRRFMKKHYESPRPAYIPGTDFDGGCEVVQLHGDLENLRCTMCSTQVEWTDEETEIYLGGAAPNCHLCAAKSEQRQASGKRGLAVGCLRPNIVLYGEDHPCNTLLTPLIPFDATCQPEVMIIMGTSLKVFGLQKIVREFAKSVHAHKNGKGRVIFVNRTRPAETTWDGVIDDFVSMDCDDWVQDVKSRRPDLWLRQGDIELTVTKSSQSKRKRKSVGDGEDSENRHAKKPKITVEIFPDVPKSAQRAPTTPSRKKLIPTKLNLPSNYPNRSILSPLAQAKRPPISPLSSPVRMDDEDQPPSPTRRRTPKRPAFSPFTPGVLSGSKLKTEVFRDEPVEPGLSTRNTDLDELEAESLLDEPTSTSAADKFSSENSIESREASFVAQLWQRVRVSRAFGNPRRRMASEAGAQDDAIVVDTPTRGPRGRTIDVFRP